MPKIGKYVKHTGELVMCSEKHVLVKIFFKRGKYEFATTYLSRKYSPFRGNTLTLR